MAKNLGEFDLIRKIAQKTKIFDPKIFQGIGDDCAVIERGKNYELLTTDMLVEDDHFCLFWQTPEQIGMKVLEVNVSDIAAMGGIPKYALVALCLKPGFSQKFFNDFLKGVHAVCRKYQISLVGGDLTHGEKMVVSVVLIGEAEKEFLKLRSGAKAGDFICVTGELGASAAGLEILRKFWASYQCTGTSEQKSGFPNKEFFKKIPPEFEFVLKKHLEPKAHLKEGRIIAPYANSMIDVSDGLGADLRHICEESKTGARIYSFEIPIDAEVRNVAQFLGKNYLDFALSGGEDFELIFTISSQKLIEMRCEHPEITAFEIGEIVPAKKGLKLILSGEEKELPGGYDHFKS